MQRDRGEEDAARDELRHQLGRERPGRARHLGAAGVQGEDRLVRVEWELRTDVAVADRVAVPVEVLLERCSELEPSDHQAPLAGVGRDELDPAAVGQLETCPDRRRPQRGSLPGSQLERPGLSRELGREMQLERLPLQPGGKGRGQRRRGVDHEQVARPEDRGQVAEGAVREGAVGACRDEERDVVAPPAANLGRLGRVAELPLLEGAHAGAPASSAAV